MNLYLTADKIGEQSGGGIVTYNEAKAFAELDPQTKVLSRKELEQIQLPNPQEPWHWDQRAFHLFGNQVKLCHIYSGTFSETVKKLKQNGAKVTYTIAAHDRFISRSEHEKFGVPFAQLYPHLCEEHLWSRYIEGYRLADVIVCPSVHAADCVRRYGGIKRIEIIPHGVDLPENTKPPPKHFVVGYLGSYGCDKGVRYLLEAWKKLNYKDATLILAGRDSTSENVKQLVKFCGGGNIILAGWQPSISHFYSLLSLYCQPSASEGFGCEVLEALAHGRSVVCSQNAGASYLLPPDATVKPMDALDLANRIDEFKEYHDSFPNMASFTQQENKKLAEHYTWDKVRQQYQELWRNL